MTDSYIWQKVRQRFLSIEGTYKNINNEEIDIIAKEPEETRSGDIEYRYTNVIEPNEASSRCTLRSKNRIWFEIFPLHIPPSQQELGKAGRNRWKFGLQINVNSPKDFGTYDTDVVYDAIAAQFKRGDIFDGIRVLQTAYRSSARMYDDFYSVPVTIMVQADLEN